LVNRPFSFQCLFTQLKPHENSNHFSCNYVYTKKELSRDCEYIGQFACEAHKVYSHCFRFLIMTIVPVLLILSGKAKKEKKNHPGKHLGFLCWDYSRAGLLLVPTQGGTGKTRIFLFLGQIPQETHCRPSKGKTKFRWLSRRLRNQMFKYERDITINNSCFCSYLGSVKRKRQGRILMIFQTQCLQYFRYIC